MRPSMEGVHRASANEFLERLQTAWDEIGEKDSERDAQLLELEKKCVAVYRDAVAGAQARCQQLKQALDAAHKEAIEIWTALRVPAEEAIGQSGPLQQQLSDIQPVLESLRVRRDERRQQMLLLHQKIQNNATDLSDDDSFSDSASEGDLSDDRLAELEGTLAHLQDVKRQRIEDIKTTIEDVKALCASMALPFSDTMAHLHPSVRLPEQAHAEAKEHVAKEAMEALKQLVDKLKQQQKARMLKLSELGATIVQLHHLMETPSEERGPFHDVIINIGASSAELYGDGMLSEEMLGQVQAEVDRLEHLKTVRLRELLLKKRVEVEEICASTHMLAPADSTAEQLISIIEAGLVDPSDLLANMEEEVAKAMDAKLSRKEILDAMERWQRARAEEVWLEDYEKDQNRYVRQRGQHLMLQRAENARKDLKKLPDVVRTLMARVMEWEGVRQQEFLYDGESLLELLKADAETRTERELAKKRHLEQSREEKRRRAEDEVKFGSTPHSTSKSTATTPMRRPMSGCVTPVSDRRLSMAPLAGTDTTPSASDRRLSMTGGAAAVAHGSGVRGGSVHGNGHSSSVRREKPRPMAPLNVVALAKDRPATAKTPNVTTAATTPPKGFPSRVQESLERTPLSPHRLTNASHSGEFSFGSSIGATEGIGKKTAFEGFVGSINGTESAKKGNRPAGVRREEVVLRATGTENHRYRTYDADYETD